MHTGPVGQRRARHNDRAESSGLVAATIMIAQPAWQLPMTVGLPSALGWSAISRSRNVASARAMSLSVCPGTGSGTKPIK